MTDEALSNRYRRERYRSDPEYRERVLSQQKARRLEQSARQRERYRHDEAYRQKCLERARQRHAANRDCR